MKKVLSFVLVLAMILGSVATVFAGAAVTAVTKDNTVVPFADAEDSGVATILKDMGALKGNENGLVNLKGTLSRAEAATIVVRALGLEDLGKVPTATKFKDVAKDAWYSGYVAQAAAVGAMKGQSATTFAPEANITLDECVALVAQTLGYDAAHLAGSWPVNYRNVARQIGYLGTVSVGTAEATREDLINLIFNALDCHQVEWVENTDGGYVGTGINGAVYSFAGETLFTAMTGIATKAGVIYRQSETANVVDSTVQFANGFDASAFFGKKAYLLQKYDKTGEKLLGNIGIYKLDTTTLTGTLSAQRGETVVFDKFVVDGKEYKFDLVSSGTTTLAASYFSGNQNVYRNGITKSSVTLSKDDTYEMSVEFADTAKTKIATIASISFWHADKFAIVDATSAALLADGNIVKLNSKNYLTDSDFATTKASVSSSQYVYLANSCVVEGDVTALEDIQKGDVVEIFEGKVKGQAEAGNVIVKVVVTRNTVTGTISNVDSTTLTVNGTAYKAYTGATTLGAVVPKAASEYALNLASNGQYVKVALATADTKADYVYAFVTGYKPVKADQGEKVKEDVTYASIWLTVPGETEVQYNTLKCLTADAVHTNAAEFTPGAFVKFSLKDGELNTLTKAGLTGNSVMTVGATGIINGYKVTDDTKIYKQTSNGATELVKDSNYTVLATSDVASRTFGSATLKYVVDEVTKKVVAMVVYGNGTATGDVSYITGAAFVKATYNTASKKWDAKFLTVDGEKTLALAADKVAELKTTEAGVITLTAGEYTTFAKFNTSVVACTNRATIEAASFSGDELELDEEVYYVAADAQVWAYDSTAAAKNFAVADFDAVKKDTLVRSLIAVDFNGDGEIDLILMGVGNSNPLADF